MTTSPPPRRRADAERSRSAILDAARRVLVSRPNAGLAAIAAEAGVTRQTVYAHFASREELRTAVADHVTEQALAAMHAADLDNGSASRALLRILDVGWRASEDLPALQQTTSPLDDHERHAPVRDLLVRLIRRGQREGEFDRTADPNWLAAAVIGLGHAAGAEVGSGRMSPHAADRALRAGVLDLVTAASGRRPAAQTRNPPPPEHPAETTAGS